MNQFQGRDAELVIHAVRRAVALSKPVCMEDKTFAEMTEAELARVHQWQRMVHALMAGLDVVIVDPGTSLTVPHL